MSKISKISDQIGCEVEDTISFEDIINQYKILSVKLNNYATLVSMNDEESRCYAREEAKLLDSQHGLLFKALNKDPQSLSDVKSMLLLWALEEIRSCNPATLTLPQQLANKALQYLEK